MTPLSADRNQIHPSDAGGDYLQRLDHALGALPEATRQDIVREIASHLAERAARGDLDAALCALGPPHDFARSFVEDYDLTTALNRAAPLALLLNMLGRAARSGLAFTASTVAIALYLFAAAFALVAGLKPVVPNNVGLWRTPRGLDFGALYGPPHDQPELIGYWIIPLAVVAAVIAYMAATLLLRTSGRLLLKRRTLSMG